MGIDMESRHGMDLEAEMELEVTPGIAHTCVSMHMHMLVPHAAE